MLLIAQSETEINTAIANVETGAVTITDNHIGEEEEKQNQDLETESDVKSDEKESNIKPEETESDEKESNIKPEETESDEKESNIKPEETESDEKESNVKPEETELDIETKGDELDIAIKDAIKKNKLSYLVGKIILCITITLAVILWLIKKFWPTKSKSLSQSTSIIKINDINVKVYISQYGTSNSHTDQLLNMIEKVAQNLQDCDAIHLIVEENELIISHTVKSTITITKHINYPQNLNVIANNLVEYFKNWSTFFSWILSSNLLDTQEVNDIVHCLWNKCITVKDDKIIIAYNTKDNMAINFSVVTTNASIPEIQQKIQDQISYSKNLISVIKNRQEKYLSYLSMHEKTEIKYYHQEKIWIEMHAKKEENSMEKVKEKDILIQEIIKKIGTIILSDRNNISIQDDQINVTYLTNTGLLMKCTGKNITDIESTLALYGKINALFTEHQKEEKMGSLEIKNNTIELQYLHHNKTQINIRMPMEKLSSEKIVQNIEKKIKLFEMLISIIQDREINQICSIEFTDNVKVKYSHKKDFAVIIQNKEMKYTPISIKLALANKLINEIGEQVVGDSKKLIIDDNKVTIEFEVNDQIITVETNYQKEKEKEIVEKIQAKIKK